MSYYLAPSLRAFFDEINERYPKRDTTSDGWIGDPSHAATKSDHNPDWDAGGVVRAIDVDVTDRDPRGNLAREVVEAAKGDPRVWYVIHQFPDKPPTIWSRTYNWVPRRYTGSNPHATHIHISIRPGRRYEDDTSRWLTTEKRRVRPIAIDLSEVQERMRAVADGGQVTYSPHVRRLQRAYNDRYPNDKITVDGLAGEETLDAWGRHERSTKGEHRPRIPGPKSLGALVAPRFTWRR